MTEDTPDLPTPVSPTTGRVDPDPAQTTTVHRPNTGLIALAAIVLLVVIVGVVLWRQGSAASSQVAQMQAQVDALKQSQGQIETLKSRLDALEARPAPPPPADLRPLQQRLTALEQKPAPQASLDGAGQQQIAALAGRIDGIAARQNQLGTQEQADITRIEQTELGKINDQIASLDTRLTAAAKAGGEIAAINERDARLAQVQAAGAALTAGRPLGTISGAPAALAKYATIPPPTEASLRLSFDAAAAEASRAGQPYTEKMPFATRLWDRLQSGVVVREGDRVIVGDAVSGVLEHAKRQLVAGDLPGAVSALDGLAGPAAAAMAPWRTQAQSLIDARAALISAAHS